MVVCSCSKCVQSRGGFAEVHGGFGVDVWWFAVVQSKFEVEVVSQGFTVVYSGSRWFTVVRSVFKVEVVS